MAAAAAHAVKNNRKLHPDLRGKVQVTGNFPARTGWGETARMLHPEVAQVRPNETILFSQC